MFAFLTDSDLDKAPRLNISIVIWIFSSDTICQLNQFNTNSEAAMLSRLKLPLYIVVDHLLTLDVHHFHSQSQQAP